MQGQKKNSRLNGLLEVIPRLWRSKDENDEYLDLTWVSPNYTLETSKQKKAKGEVQFTSTFVRLLRWSPGKTFIFRAWSSILSGVESGKTKRQGRKAETLKKTVHLPYLYHFLSVDFKHFSRLKIYRFFFENICHDSSVLRAPQTSPPSSYPPSFRGVLITSFLQSMMRWMKHETVVSINLLLNSQ